MATPVEDLIIVSVDDHVVEPPDMFDGRLPQKYQDAAPKVVNTGDGRFIWAFEGFASRSLTTVATAGRPIEEREIEPTSYADVRPGTYDVHERVKDMSVNGILGSMNFPSFPRFCGQMFADVAAKDPDLALAVVQAYNNWHIEGWCGEYPDRFIPCAIVPLWDPQLMAAEVQRVSELGCHAVTFAANPYKLGLPSLHSDHWDPFWAACDELETIVCTHLGTGMDDIVTAPDAPHLARINVLGTFLLWTASDLVWSPVFRKFERLKVALSEGGIGWVPYFLETAEFVYDHHVSWVPESKFYDRRPTEIFKEHIVTCFIEDAVGLEGIHHMNPDMVMLEVDYPHPDSNWPLSPEHAWKDLQQLPNEDLWDKITHANAMRVFQFDPFAIRPREQCTVGALRAEVAGHDIDWIPGRALHWENKTQGESAAAFKREAATGVEGEAAAP
jgi:predicted TIM-barrel fold metal-dependent hydrolase